ncbi:carboxylesterase [Apodospora peruviana]|uniref:Carboxylic ester hydrolase n=1 Tax=Apodospora peruviana TaxID=516989 RepID=A0AAE0M0D7_9PEZI|nr:carboxylesterase [Apodospora peruviana]
MGNEDCLFLNVLAPANAKNLPVLFWIHGGGYGQGSASTFDFSYLDKTANNGFVSVVIQYRLGAFGFLSSADVAKHGIPNAALHDMRFALQWVKKYISRFGGDPDQVTIAGESAGGGSVMLMAMANGGEDGTTLFRRAIASSPYLPTQPNYDDELPTDYYLQFAQRAGCLGNDDNSLDSAAVFKCLQNADSILLQKASANTSYSAKYGQWAFIPVTDGELIKELPTQQLTAGKVNGERIVTGNNANEGTYFVPQNITTESLFSDFVRFNYPQVSPENLTAVLGLYNISGSPVGPKHDTDGLHPPYATQVSNYAVGWQQAANNLYAETTFVCPAYWLADAYSKDTTKKAWRYQFSIPDATHGKDIAPLTLDPATSDAMDPTFRKGFQSIWGQFIVSGDPTLSTSAIFSAGGDDVLLAAAGRDAWLPWGSAGKFDMLNLNVTATKPTKAEWKVVDGKVWEGGRGARCDLWAKLGAVVQE